MFKNKEDWCHNVQQSYFHMFPVSARENGTESIKQIKLEVYGKARREAARRRKSEWKVKLGSRNSSCSNGSWQMTPKTVS